MYNINKLSSHSYTPDDPRLKIDGRYLQLDGPVLNGMVKMKDVYNYRPGYKYIYNSYKDIGGGQITYYLNPELNQPFIPQLFNDGTYPMTSNIVLIDPYIDPMGNVKPHYYRVPGYNSPMSSASSPHYGLSSISDKNEHIRDLMSKQLAKINQSKQMLL